MNDFQFQFDPPEPNACIYTSGYKFQDAVVHHSANNTVTISTFNVGTNVPNDFIYRVSDRAKELFLLVGTSPYGTNTPAVLSLLKEYAKARANIHIHLGTKLHVKAITIHQPKGIIGWAGSLNLITPTLHDLMVRLSKRQAIEVYNYLHKLWQQSQPL